MTFSIGNAGLFVSPICQLKSDISDFPVLILLLFQQLDPHIRHCHRQPEPETNTAFLNRSAQPWETRYILSDEDDLRIDKLCKLVSNGQISKSIDIEIMIEVFVVIACESIAFSMVLVQHRGHTVKSVPISIVFLNPEADVREQEAQYFVLRIVEDSTIPKRMVSLLTPMEVLIISPIPHIYSFQHILSSVRMHQINDYLDPHPMCLVHELLELTRRAEPRRNAEKVSAMITKGAIVRMFNDSHNLYDIIAQILNPGQDMLSKITEGVNLLLDPRHPHVAFIHLHVYVLPLRFLVLPLVETEVDVDSIESGVLVLTCIIDPGRNAIDHITIFSLYLHFQGGEVRDRDIDFAGPQSKLILHVEKFTLSHMYSPLFQPLNSPKMEMYCAQGAHQRQIYLFPSRCTPQRLQLWETISRPFQAWNSERRWSTRVRILRQQSLVRWKVLRRVEDRDLTLQFAAVV